MKGNIDKIRFANKHRQRNYGEEVEIDEAKMSNRSQDKG